MSLPLLERLAADWELLGEPLGEEAHDRFARYARLLVTWNDRVNLTAIVDEDGIVVKHFLDSLSLLLVLDPFAAAGPISLIDVGSGAGFPGMALAIVRPDWQLTLLEATRKKVEFLEVVIGELALANARAVWGRAEEAGRDPAHRARYDVVVARAVADLPVLAEYCLPFARVGGLWIAQKGPRLDDELERSRNALGQLGGRLVDTRAVAVPGMDEERRLAVIEKIRETPRVFPRRPGTPAKRPL